MFMSDFGKKGKSRMMTLIKWSHDQSDLIWLHVTLAVQKDHRMILSVTFSVTLTASRWSEGLNWVWCAYTDHNELRMNDKAENK